MQGKIFPNKGALDLGIWYILVWPYDCLESKHKQEFYFLKPYCCAIMSCLSYLMRGIFSLMDLFLEQF